MGAATGGWTGAFTINAAIAGYFLIGGVGFGCWAAVSNLASNVHTLGLFAKCYQARSPMSIQTLHLVKSVASAVEEARSMLSSLHSSAGFIMCTVRACAFLEAHPCPEKAH